MTDRMTQATVVMILTVGIVAGAGILGRHAPGAFLVGALWVLMIVAALNTLSLSVSGRRAVGLGHDISSLDGDIDDLEADS